MNPQGPGPEEKRRRGKLALQEKPPTGTLEKLVRGPSVGQALGGQGEGREAGLGHPMASLLPGRSPRPRPSSVTPKTSGSASQGHCAARR